jgi:hypothetical protein
MGNLTPVTLHVTPGAGWEVSEPMSAPHAPSRKPELDRFFHTTNRNRAVA